MAIAVALAATATAANSEPGVATASVHHFVGNRPFSTLGDGATPVSDTKKSLPHIVTTNVEHPAVEEYLKLLETRGDIQVTRVPVDHEGLVTAGDIMAAVTPATVLVSIILPSLLSLASRCWSTHPT